MDSFFKEKRIVDKKFLEWLRFRPCTITKPHPCQDETYGHHSLQCPSKGTGIKAGDNHAFTVCDFIHRAIHKGGNEDKVLKEWGFDADILQYCDEIYETYKGESNGSKN